MKTRLWVPLSTTAEGVAESRPREAIPCPERRPARDWCSRKRRGSRLGRGGSTPLRYFRKQRALWRCGVQDVSPAQSAAVASGRAAASVASEAPGSLQIEEEDPIPSFLRS
uniref:Coiled-coil domain containing 28A n=1 Tax=Molossus molossus TaxID=27622 RepID=A0A7J8GNB2_MOLMO|nr:coiled-coil domain containing 28A [Molossus molossus]